MKSIEKTKKWKRPNYREAQRFKPPGVHRRFGPLRFRFTLILSPHLSLQHGLAAAIALWNRHGDLGRRAIVSSIGRLDVDGI
jgi:hypothetical protein